MNRILISLLLVLTMSPITSAQTVNELDTCSVKAEDGSCLDLFYSTNDINFYNANDTCGGTKTIQNPAANLSIDQRIAQTFIVGFDPTSTEAMSQIVDKYKIGGLFFVGGSDNSRLTKSFFDELNKSAGIPLFIAADDEGGQVARFTKGVTPSADAMGAMNTPQIEAEGKKAGDLLVAAGLNGDLAPVLDFYVPGTPWAATERTFGRDSNNIHIAAKAGAFAKGLKGAGVTPVYKHFPGIGRVTEHTDKGPSTPQTLASIAGDIAPYRDLANQHGGAIMLSNGYITDWDANVPVSINPQAVTYLRNQLNFTGVIMTDALEVLEDYGSKAVSTPDAIARALNAGVDMPLFVLRGGEGTIQAAIDKVKADVPAAKIDAAFKNSLTIRTGTSASAQNNATNASSTTQCCAQSGSKTSVSLDGKNNTEKILNFLMNGMSYKMSLEQASGLVGNFFVEAGGTNQDGTVPDASMEIGPNPAAVSSAGFYGIAQWGGGRWTQLQDFAASNSKEWKDLDIQLRFMAWELGVGETWNGNAGGSEKRSLEAIKNLNEPGTVAVEFEALYERCGCTQEKRRTAALSVYNYYSDKAPLPASGSTASPASVQSAGANTCAGSSGPPEGNGDIAKTALGLAWPNKGKHPGTGKEVARDTYQVAMPKYNNNTTTVPWTDCGVFTATVMRMSGADPEYPGRGTSVHLSYIRSSPKFTAFIPKDTSELQPGDVGVVSGSNGYGHTYIYTGPYTGDDGVEYQIAEASLFDHVPEADKVYISDGRGPYTFGRVQKLTQV